MVNVYNSSWGLESSFGGYGSEDGKLGNPYAAFMSPNNTVLVADHVNDRFSMFTMEGEFLNHLFLIDPLKDPEALSYCEPYLWVQHYTNNSYGLYRYRLDQ